MSYALGALTIIGLIAIAAYLFVGWRARRCPFER